jgi:multicomponent Na+:H+ antiporter subunit E
VRERLLTLLWLLVVWLALWEELSITNVLSGLLLAVLLLVLFPVRERPEARRQPMAFRPARVVQLLAYFLWKLVEANVVVAWEVITPNNEGVQEGIVAVPLTGASDTVVTIVANAISLTPGTLTIEIDRGPTVLYVHVLHLRNMDRVRVDVLRLEVRVLRAFGTPVAIADGERALADAERRLSGERA